MKLGGRAFRCRGQLLEEIEGVTMPAPMKIYYNDGQHLVFRIDGHTGSAGYIPPVYVLAQIDGQHIERVLRVRKARRKSWSEIKWAFVTEAKERSLER